MKLGFFIAICFLFIYSPLIKGQVVLPLWKVGEKPYYLENTLEEYEEELWGTRCVFNVTEPSLTIYKAKGKNTRKAVLIIPGGGYGLVALYHEGYDLAKILSENGITAAVLKYRLPNLQSSDAPEKVPLTDARRAIKMLHESAENLDIDKDKIGVLGFSAGSHLATVMTLWESGDIQEKPDFSALIYGVTNLNSENLRWLEETLYFRKLNEKELKLNRLLNLVNEQTVPAFLVHAQDDDVCQIEESTLYAEKLRDHNVPFEMHIFSKGGHGFGMGRENDGTCQWVSLFVSWLKNNS